MAISFSKNFARARAALRSWPLLAVIALLLQGCGASGSKEEFDKTPEAAFLHATLERLASEDYAGVEATLDPRLIPDPQMTLEERRRPLRAARALLPAGAPLANEPVDWNFQERIGGSGDEASQRGGAVSIQYAYPSSRWILATAVLSGEAGQLRLVKLSLAPLSAPLSEIHAFSLKSMGSAHWLVLFLWLASLSVALLALIACFRARGLKRKWLWALCCLATLSSFSINWTTGETSFQLLHAALLGWGPSRVGWVGPWILTAPFPLGALALLWRLGEPPPPSAPDAAAPPSDPSAASAGQPRE